MLRRSFLAATTAALAQPADVQIQLDPAKAGPEISPHIYGHFIEHLGAVIYDGIWVGPNSPIPNINGIRRQFVDDMKAIGAPNLRWPGGCFADAYHWRDGIGKSRPRTYNYWQRDLPPGLDHTESNAFGFHEFIALCRLVGAEPYVAANVGSGSPREFHDWMLYCNAPTGTVSLAGERAGNGQKEPFAIKWWGVGNESWGCGGNMKPGEYATHYRRFVTQIPVYPPAPVLVATGPRGHSKDMDIAWTEGFFAAMQGHRVPVDGFSLHFYSDFRNGRGRALNFDAAGWHDVIREGMRTEEVIEQHWAIMGKYDKQHRTKLVIDEWGVWYSKGDEIAPGHILTQPATLRDALHTAVTFDVFNRHADKVAMANVAQTINCLHSLFLADGAKYERTPVYDVFALYKPHMGARSVPVKVSGLSASASLRDRMLTVTVTNPSLDNGVNVRLDVSGVAEVRGQVLTHPDMRSRKVTLAPLPATVRSAQVAVTLPKQSITRLDLRLA